MARASATRSDKRAATKLRRARPRPSNRRGPQNVLTFFHCGRPQAGAGPARHGGVQPAGRLRTFLREVRIEMSKVTWPPRKELITSTGVVIVAVVIAGAYIGVWDFIWNLNRPRRETGVKSG